MLDNGDRECGDSEKIQNVQNIYDVVIQARSIFNKKFSNISLAHTSQTTLKSNNVKKI
jgi:hypothetical protein